MTNDPDLDQAIEDFQYLAIRLRQLQRQIVQADATKEYRQLAPRQFELGELVEQFNERGERLQLAEDRSLAGRGLLMVTEEATRLWERSKRRPTFERLYEAVHQAGTLQGRLRDEAVSEVVRAEYVRKVATHNAAAITGVLRYLESSR